MMMAISISNVGMCQHHPCPDEYRGGCGGCHWDRVEKLQVFSRGRGGGVTQQSGEQENIVVFITMQSNWIRLDSVSFLYLVQLDECYEERKIDGRSVKIGHISANRGSL